MAKRDEEEAKRDDDTEGEERDSTPGDDSAPEADGPEGERDASTRGVAEALGVDEAGEEAAEAAPAPAEEKAPPNRTARRRDQALERRKKRSPKAKAAGADDEPADEEGAIEKTAQSDLPKDKNARAKELLKRRQQVSASTARVASGLDTGEMVQDALARGSSAAGRWFMDNVRYVVAGAAVVALGVGGFFLFRSQEAEKAGAATGALTDALAADRGRVLKEDKRPDEEKQLDPTRVFPTSEARADAAKEGYEKALTQTSEAGPTTLARLGLAGAKLEKGDAKGAIAEYATVLASPLAGADVDVRARAVEGTALAQEAEGNLDAALKSYEELTKIDAKGFEELGLYHQARVHLQKGEKDQAKELLKKAREKLSAPGEAGQAFPFLEAVVDGHLRSLDPSAAPARTQLGGAKGSSMTPEDLDRIQEQLRKALEKKQGAHEGEGEHEGEGMPTLPQQEPQ